MRITQQTVFNNFMRDVATNRQEMAEIQSSLSSSKSVRYPSQDPVSFQRSRVISEDIREAEQYQGNINSGLRQARLAQDALDQSLDELIEIKRILVQSSSDSFDEGDRENMADEIAGIRESLIATLNLSYGDRFLFAGTNSADQPFEEDPTAVGGVAYNGNGNSLKISAEAGVSIDISITGEELRATESGDFFEIIGSIEQALRDSDSTALNDLIPASDDLIDHVTDVTARLGNNINRMDFVYEQYESTKITQEAEISKLVDTDYAQAISDLQKNEVAYESAMAVHTRMFSNTLLNYL